MTEAEIALIQAEVRELAEAWVNAWNDVETDCETAAGLWHPDHAVYFSGGERVSGQAWIDYCNRTTANRASVDGHWTNSEVRVLSPDAAVFLGSYQSTMGYVDDSPTVHWPTANQTILVERTATGWGISFFTNFNGPSEIVEEG
jgi:uncharacterized protein (TIGR02246 family)